MQEEQQDYNIENCIQEKDLNVISGYAPQVGINESNKREDLDDMVQNILMNEKLYIRGGLNVHVGYENVHGGFGGKVRFVFPRQTFGGFFNQSVMLILPYIFDVLVCFEKVMNKMLSYLLPTYSLSSAFHMACYSGSVYHINYSFSLLIL